MWAPAETGAPRAQQAPAWPRLAKAGKFQKDGHEARGQQRGQQQDSFQASKGLLFFAI